MQIDGNKVIAAIIDRTSWGILVALGWAIGQALVGVIPGI